MPLHNAANVAKNMANIKCLVEAGADVHATDCVCPYNHNIMSHIHTFIDIVYAIIDRTIELLYIWLSNNQIILKQSHI